PAFSSDSAPALRSSRTFSAPRSGRSATPSMTRTAGCRRSRPARCYKRNNQGAVIHAIGGRDANGVDFYLAATKLFLSESLLVNATIRETRANQFGILGFGGDKNNDYSTEFEGSAALLLSRQLAVGAEFRTKPDNLKFAKEGHAFDVFLAYFFNKNVSATLAFVALGDIATQRNQNGVYASLQVGF